MKKKKKASSTRLARQQQKDARSFCPFARLWRVHPGLASTALPRGSRGQKRAAAPAAATVCNTRAKTLSLPRVLRLRWFCVAGGGGSGGVSRAEPHCTAMTLPRLQSALSRNGQEAAVNAQPRSLSLSLSFPQVAQTRAYAPYWVRSYSNNWDGTLYVTAPCPPSPPPSSFLAPANHTTCLLPPPARCSARRTRL